MRSAVMLQCSHGYCTPLIKSSRELFTQAIKGAWRTYSPPNLPQLPYLRKVSL